MKRFAPIRMAAWAAVALMACTAARAAEKLTYVDLIHRMTDMEHLAVLPEAGENCAQWSSYDRASKYDEATDKYIAWGANRDGVGIIRSEGDQVVLAEMQGPGCIWRIRSAAAGAGHVKIYLDGQAKPAVDRPFNDFFTAKQAPLNYPALGYRLEGFGSRGQNLYFPIPYQKSCKIVADKDWGKYFHFTYATFPKGTSVPTFNGELSAEEAAELQRVSEFLGQRLGSDPAGDRPGQETAARTVAVPAGKTAEVLSLAGPRALTAIRVRIKLKDRDDQMAALRKLALRITWDGQPKPAVWCPLGDSFGTAPGVNLYKTLPTGMTEDGFYSYWYMPLARSARIELTNDDQSDREVQFEIVHAPLNRPFEGLGHFHAKWHRDIFPVREDRRPDWTMLRAEGRGRFCGVMLHVWNPRGGWWGEGDEKFFVDGEKFPSTFGTGSEDYFGYAWCDPHLFQRAYHAQTMTENNRGHQSVLRWHIVDNVPFQKSFEGCIEKYFPNKPGTLYACTAIWYLAPDGADPIEPAPAAERGGYWSQTIEVKYKVLGRTGGAVQDQDMHRQPGGKWRGGYQLWWTKTKPGDKLDLAVTAVAAGRHDVSVILTKARDYGIVQFYLDGKKLGEPIDLYNPAVIQTSPIALGTHELSQGEHKLTVEIVGANPRAVKSYMFGLDEIILRPAK
jgi:hypothetical protein